MEKHQFKEAQSKPQQRSISSENFIRESQNPFRRNQQIKQCLLCSEIYQKSKYEHDAQCRYRMESCQTCFERYPKPVFNQHKQQCERIKKEKEIQRQMQKRRKRQIRRQRQRNYQRIVTQLRNRQNFHPLPHIYGCFIQPKKDYQIRTYRTENEIIHYTRQNYTVIHRQDDQRLFNSFIERSERRQEKNQNQYKLSKLEQFLLKCQRIKIKEDMNEKEICVICQYEYKQQQDMLKLPCKHHYHQLCIQKWLYQRTVCPMCKKVVQI